MIGKKSTWFLVLAFPLLMFLGWPPHNAFPLLLIGFVPLLWLEHEHTESKEKRSFMWLLYPALLLWNLACTWWIVYASAGGMVMAVFSNALLMSIPFLLFRYTKRVLGNRLGYASLPLYWITFEFCHLRWDLTWPWLTLGNGLASNPAVFQWYEFTGSLGGTFWILAVNILIFFSLKGIGFDKSSKRSKYLFHAKLLLFMVVPIIYSLWQFKTYEATGSTSRVVAVQPNIDPYNNKFDRATIDEQMQSLLHLTDSLSSYDTEFILWPETALPFDLYEEGIPGHPSIVGLQEYLKKYADATLITGITTFVQYEEKATPTARKYQNGRCCYDIYNTALQLEGGPTFKVYHKSKLVPGVEKMPFPEVLGFLEDFSIQMGGASGSLGEQEDRTVFYNSKGVGTAPVICYESVFGDYVAQYVRNGAQFISIITNDGWWKDTPGYRQHAQYASLRAVECRRSIARSANTGTSAFYDEKGVISQATDFWVPAVISAEITLNDEITFYVKYGDYIGRFALITSILLLLIAFVKPRLAKK